MFPAIFLKPVQWLLNRLLRKQSSKLCGQCGSQIPLPTQINDALWNMIVVCPMCGSGKSLLAIGNNHPDTDLATGLPAEQAPSALSPVTSRTADPQRWILPAKGGCNLMLFFGAFWLGASSLMLFVKFGDQATHSFSVLGFNAFRFAFIAIGCGLVWIGLQMSFLRHELELEQGALHYRKKIFGRTKHLVWPLPTLESIELKEFYQKNYQPVFGIEIRGSLGKIRFGSQLKLEEQKELLGQLRQALLPSPGALPQPQVPALPATKPLQPAVPNGSGGTDEVVLDLPGKWHPALVVPGLFITAVSAFMSYQGLTSLFRDSSIFSKLFDIFWCLGPALIGCLGLGLLLTAWHLKFRDRKIHIINKTVRLTEADRTGSTVTTWARHEVRGAIVAQVGSTNGTPSWRAEILLIDRVLPFGWGRPQSELQQQVNAIRAALGK